MKEIVETKPVMIGINLEQPFELGFGTLKSLPRVLYTVSVLERDQVVSGIGEASIDFPFATYDAWDIYKALSEIELVGKEADRDSLLKDNDIRKSLLKDTPAAYAAFNMAIDDLSGKLEQKSVIDFYGQKRKGGRALASISYKDEVNLLVEEVEGKFKKGFIPKPKVGRGVEEDFQTIKSVSAFVNERNISFVLDFNAAYQPEQFAILLARLRNAGCDLGNLLFLEQPTKEESGVEGLVFAKNEAAEAGFDIKIMADETFVTYDQALQCVENGIILNFKIHKVGGIFHALEIEKSMPRTGSENMVGGTFPTAIGRVYDQQAASVLETTSLPGDGWEPSTDWFVGEKHLIREHFLYDSRIPGFVPFRGHGSGVTVETDKVKRFVVDDPREEYRRIRSGKDGRRLIINIKENNTYADKYKERSGKEFDWNL